MLLFPILEKLILTIDFKNNEQYIRSQIQRDLGGIIESYFNRSMTHREKIYKNILIKNAYIVDIFGYSKSSLVQN